MPLVCHKTLQLNQCESGRRLTTSPCREREREGERKEKKEAMCHVLQPGKLTWNPKKEVLEDDVLFQLGDF